MTRDSSLARICAVAALLGLAIGVGCRRPSKPPPGTVEASLAELGVGQRWNSDIVVDSAMLGAAASAEEVARPSNAQAAAVSITVDDSTAESLAQGYAAVLSAAQLQQLAELVLPDQKERVIEIQQAIQPLIEAQAQLASAVNEKFPGEKLPTALSTVLGSGFGGQITFGSVEPDPADENTAIATFQTTGGAEAKRTLKKVDDHWRVDETELPPAEVLSQMAPRMQQLADNLRAVAGRVSSGEIADLETLQTEVKECFTSIAAGAVPIPEAAPSDAVMPAPEPVAAPAPAAAPRAEPHSDVDDVVSGPGHLRRR